MRCHEPPELPADPVAALQAQHAALGLVIDERTGDIDWWGEPLDLGWAAVVLLKTSSSLKCRSTDRAKRTKDG